MDETVRRAQRGDAEAFAALFERSRPVLWRAAIAVLGNEHDAADALQDALVRAWQAIPRFAGRSDVETWLVRIVLRVCFDAQRRRAREVPHAPEAMAADGAATPAPAHDLDEAMDVRQALAELSGDDRLLLALFYVEDWPVKRIAAVLDASEGAIRTRLVRARSRLKCAYDAPDAQAEKPSAHGGRQKPMTMKAEVAR